MSKATISLYAAATLPGVAVGVELADNTALCLQSAADDDGIVTSTFSTMESPAMPPPSPSKGIVTASRSIYSRAPLSSQRQKNVGNAAARLLVSPSRDAIQQPREEAQNDAVPQPFVLDTQILTVNHSVETFCSENSIDLVGVNVTRMISSTHDVIHWLIVIVTTDDDPTCKLSRYQRSKLAKKSVEKLEFIVSRKVIFVTSTEMKAKKDHQVRVVGAKKEEILHNKTNVLEEPKSETTPSKPSPSTCSPLFEQNTRPNDQRVSNAKVKTFRYNPSIAITNTEATDSPTEALFFPSESSTLKGLTFLLSGKFHKHDSGQPSSSPYDKLHIGKDTITGAIKDNGGRCLTRLSNSVDFLVVGAEPGYTKFMNAIRKCIRVISVNDLHQLATDEITVEALRLKEDVKVKKFSVMSASAKRSAPKKGNKGTKRKNDSEELNVRVKKRKSKKVANGPVDVAAAVGEERITLPPAIPRAATEERPRNGSAVAAESVLGYGGYSKTSSRSAKNGEAATTRTPWTSEKDERLRELVKQHGKKWTLIQKSEPLFNDKSTRALRERFMII